MLQRFDHAVIAVRDLSSASQDMARLLGRPPAWRGTHPGAGTANALFRLEACYLELIATDGDGPQGRAIAAVLDSDGEGLVALALGTDDVEACARDLRERGVPLPEPQPGEGRDDHSGAVRCWRSVFLPRERTRGLLLFAIEHGSAGDAWPHPEPDVAANTAVSAVDHVVVISPDLSAARRLYGEALGLRLALDRVFESRGVRILFFRIGGVTVEVAGPLDPPADAPPTDRFGGLAYRVADVDAARSRLLAADFDVSEVRAGAKPGTRVCTVRRETHGVPTLLIEPGPPAARAGCPPATDARR